MRWLLGFRMEMELARLGNNLRSDASSLPALCWRPFAVHLSRERGGSEMKNLNVRSTEFKEAFHIHPINRVFNLIPVCHLLCW